MIEIKTTAMKRADEIVRVVARCALLEVTGKLPFTDEKLYSNVLSQFQRIVARAGDAMLFGSNKSQPHFKPRQIRRYQFDD